MGLRYHAANERILVYRTDVRAVAELARQPERLNGECSSTTMNRLEGDGRGFGGLIPS